MADGSELATLSNVSKAFGLSANTSAATGNELVTLSNVKALLENGGGGGGNSFSDNISWSDISSMADEVNTLGQTAFREKYKGLLWSSKLIELTFSSDRYTRAYVVAYLIGLAHDPISSATNKYAGFTFVIPSPNFITASGTMFGYRNGYDWGYQNSELYKSMVNKYNSISSTSFKQYVKTVQKNNDPDSASNDNFFMLSTTEIGLTPNDIYPNNIPGHTGEYTTRDVGYTYEGFDTEYVTDASKYRDFLYTSIGSLANKSATYDYGMIFRNIGYEVNNTSTRSAIWTNSITFIDTRAAYTVAFEDYYNSPSPTYYTAPICFCI